MTSPPASVARPWKDGDLRVTNNIGHGFGIADGDRQIALCMTEVDAEVLVALANASPAPPTTESDYNAGVRAAAKVCETVADKWRDWSGGYDAGRALADAETCILALLRPATESASAPKVTKGMRRVHVCCGTFSIMISRVEEDAPDDLVTAAAEALCQMARMRASPSPPATDHSELAKRLREKAVACRDFVRRHQGNEWFPPHMGTDAIAEAELFEACASALDAAREGEGR